MPIRVDEFSGEESESFELIGELGKGGFATTFKARVLDPELIDEFGAEVVALKVPHKHKRRILQREVTVNAILHQRLKDLRSENVVRYLGFDVYHGKIVMAMEYVPHGSLRRILGMPGGKRILALAEALAIAEGVLEGLSLIHHEKIFHRDIKPENILMAGSTPKIADLGISRLLSPNELASTTTGTLFYMAPELLSAKGASFPADIWSVGVMLYEMVTGRLPFGDPDTPVGTMADLIRQEREVRACETCSEVPEDLSDVIEQALAKDPSKRFEKAEEMSAELKRCRRSLQDDLERELSALSGLSYGVDGAATMEEKYRAIVDRYPDDARAYQHLGEFYNRSHRYRDAASIFERGIALDPNAAVLHWNLALAYEKLGKRPEAAEELERAIALGLPASLKRHARILLDVLRDQK